MSIKTPADFSRRVLVCVTGMSPAVVTETIYALATQQDWHPTELIVLTTLQGKRGFESDLIDPETGKLWEMYRDYPQFQPLHADSVSVRALSREDGEELNDIQTAEDNLRFADVATALLRDLTNDNACAIHVSIAGGRKTMGFFIGYALSIFGRFQDRLSHVLVPDEFEGNRAFFYPTPNSRIIREKNNKGWSDTYGVRVSLSEIPFVSLRSLVRLPIHEDGSLTYSEVVERINNQAADETLVIDLAAREVKVRGVPVELKPAELDRFAWLCWRTIHGESRISFKDRRGADVRRPDAAEEYVWFCETAFLGNLAYGGQSRKQTYASMGVEMKGDTPVADPAMGMESNLLALAKSGVGSALKKAVGAKTAAKYHIGSYRDERLKSGKGKGIFGLDLSPELISLVNAPEELLERIKPVPERPPE